MPAIDAVRACAHRHFTVDDILRMQDDGIFSEDDRFELIGGEIIPMAPKYFPHDHLKNVLGASLAAVRLKGLTVAFETGMQLDADSFVLPDLGVYQGGTDRDLLGAESFLLAIEISASTLRHDLGRKASAYARAGLPELWVIDVQSRRTYSHKGPSEAGWASVAVREADEELTFAGLPGWRVRLKDL